MAEEHQAVCKSWNKAIVKISARTISKKVALNKKRVRMAWVLLYLHSVWLEIRPLKFYVHTIDTKLMFYDPQD